MGRAASILMPLQIKYAKTETIYIHMVCEFTVL
jgi:hypothetical protein